MGCYRVCSHSIAAHTHTEGDTMRHDPFEAWIEVRNQQFEAGLPMVTKAGLNFRWSADGVIILDADSRFADLRATGMWRRVRTLSTKRTLS